MIQSVKVMARLKKSSVMHQLDSAGVWMEMDENLKERGQEETWTAQKLVFIMFIPFFNPMTPNIREQILLPCPYTFLIKVLGRC